jgi:2'-5' RNA ligase
MAKKPFIIGGVIWPDQETQRSVNEIRKRWDPHFTVIAPHITIIFPTDTEAALQDVIVRVTNAVEGFRRFTARLDRVSSVNLLAPDWPAATSALLAYPNAVNAIFLLSGEGTREILELKERLGVALELDTPLIQYPPYLTLGQTLSDRDYGAALNELSGHAPDHEFSVAGFDLLTQDDSGGWQTARTFPFSQAEIC